ncbi:hypothetical protein NLG97_g9442 [Lecanicillium saksenae]|uniref:Uncharacterized protein n=1 Tax=Lecanicillium saksenae TaxID=468837 RepID=A0ACC1QI03_9HYPO|nr:hypothetical protein NLG97_g9442 [Lecanicillium saksenae]
MAVAMLAGRCYQRMLRSVDGFVPLDLERLVHVGMRDVTEESGIWKKLEGTMVHVDLDCLDASVGKANKLASYGGLLEDDLEMCLENVVKQTRPVSLTLASYDPEFDGEGTVAATAIRYKNVECHVVKFSSATSVVV